LGDFDERSGSINNNVITNNNDSKKVLATVAAAVHDFTLRYPGVAIYAKGSTPGRTRLYRIGITANWKSIISEYEVYGFVEEKWQRFKFQVEYDGFLVHRK
jgi:hypothetical protein